jgi:hypothetical protein
MTDYRAADQARRDMIHRVVMAADHCLTDTERNRFLSVLAERYPNMRGADVADVLDIFADADMYLDISEPMADLHHGEWSMAHTYAVYLAVFLDDIATWENVSAYAARIEAQLVS